jgi:hypothetical protein
VGLGRTVAVASAGTSGRRSEARPRLKQMSGEPACGERMRFVIVPGNGGCGRDTAHTNWYGWFHEEMQKRGHESICTEFNTPTTSPLRSPPFPAIHGKRHLLICSVR